MKTLKKHIAIIGAGTAGLSAFRAAHKHTDDLILIEGGKYGTTCARVGCMPSKLLIAAAEAAHQVQTASKFGIQATGQVDGKAVMQRIRQERDRFVSFVLDSIDEIDDGFKVRGYAHFLDDHTLEVDGHTRIEAERIVIATGSRPRVFPIFKQAGDRLLTNEDIFEWPNLPESVAVFGPGVIGLELGQALHRLGVRVALFGNDSRVGSLSDPRLQETTRDIFQAEFPLYPSAQTRQIENTGKDVIVTFWDGQGHEKQERFEYLLAATGRVPNLDKLQLVNTTLALDKKGLPIFDTQTLQTSVPHIFIAGDANENLPLLHEAADEGRIAGHNALIYPQIEVGQRRSHLSIVFTDPQMITVGHMHRDLPHDCFVTGEVSFENQGRSRVILKNKGRLHIYAESGTGKFLGAEMVGPAAEHIGHLLSWAHQQKMTISQMLKMPFYHPVIEEGVRTALQDALKKLKTAPVNPPCFEHL